MPGSKRKFALLKKLNRLAPVWIACLCAMSLIYTWNHDWGNHQKPVEVSAGILLVSFGVMLVWLLLLSGYRFLKRILIAGALAVLVGSACLVFRVEGVSGDLVPILGFRWSDRQQLKMPAPGPAAEKAPSTSAGIPGEDNQAPGSPRDYPQFLGPARDGVIEKTGVNWDLAANPPTEIWRRPVGAGWSAFSIRGGRAVTQEQRGAQECVVCYDLLDGKLIWSHSDEARFDEVLGGAGPRATPTLTESRVFALGATGILNCLDLSDGAGIWSLNLLERYGCSNQSWGKSSSPLLAEGMVIVCVGAGNCPGLVALSQETGKEAWGSPRSNPGYSSPVLCTLAGRRQVLILNNTVLDSHSLVDGALLWSHPWPGSRPKVSQPVVIGEDKVLISSGYGVGCELIQVSVGADGSLETSTIWKNRNLKAKFSNTVIYGEDAYGLDDGILVCIDLQTGKRRWKGGRYGHGQLILADRHLVVLTERGELVIVKPDQERLLETAKIKMISGKTWNHPALAAPFLLVRNATEAACYKFTAMER